ncbi:MAG: nicotinate (nicotinamide) nucleotide adenylyltransferase [Clostridia bacterium]|nr:nicotinate (nicotinamide) nucleotide adenylyltransferase [Clostridia bacterium]
MEQEVKLIVIAGAFNPVTTAHVRLGELAQKQFAKAQIVFVPAADSFLASWKQFDEKDRFSASERIHMLHLGLEGTAFSISTCETDGKVSGKTYDTLTYLAAQYGIDRSHVFLMCGSDKLKELAHWYQAERMLQQFRLLAVRRNDERIEELVRTNAFLRLHQDHIVLLENGEPYQAISSTKIRQALHAGKLEQVCSMLPKGVYEYLLRKTDQNRPSERKGTAC